MMKHFSQLFFLWRIALVMGRPLDSVILNGVKNLGTCLE